MKERKIMEELDKEYDKDEVFDKEITQEEKVEPVVKGLTEMGAFYKAITKKLLADDAICFICKKHLDEKEPVDIIPVPNNKLEKGLVAFVSVCKKCNSE